MKRNQYAGHEDLGRRRLGDEFFGGDVLSSVREYVKRGGHPSSARLTHP
jgi:hypothetical protein